VWPELLAVVKRHKRTTEALLKNAQVHDLAGGSLTLSTTSPGAGQLLGDDLNRDVLREALNELLGVRWKVEAVVEGRRAGRGRRRPVPREAAREAARGAEAAEARELLAQRAAEARRGDGSRPPAVDPEQAALALLRARARGAAGRRADRAAGRRPRSSAVSRLPSGHVPRWPARHASCSSRRSRCSRPWLPRRSSWPTRRSPARPAAAWSPPR
jgi:DNA polymerase-3 subunit gamma/tau